MKYDGKVGVYPQWNPLFEIIPRHCLALNRLVGSITRSLEMQSMAEDDTLLNWSCPKPSLAKAPLKLGKKMILIILFY